MSRFWSCVNVDCVVFWIKGFVLLFCSNCKVFFVKGLGILVRVWDVLKIKVIFWLLRDLVKIWIVFLDLNFCLLIWLRYISVFCIIIILELLIFCFSICMIELGNGWFGKFLNICIKVLG